MRVPLLLLATVLVALSSGVSATLTVVATNRTYTHRMAAFGPYVPDSGVLAPLVPMSAIETGNNERGCALTGVPPYLQGVPWVALVQQGDCPFVDKVRNMQEMGAVLVVVGSNKPGTALVTMQADGDTSDIVVPAVYVTYEDYTELRTDSAAALPTFPSFQVFVVGYEVSYWPLVNVILARIVAPAIIMIFLYSLAFRFRQRQRQKKECAQESVVNNLPTRKYVATVNGEVDACSICLDDYVDGVELRVLPCKHEFHKPCIDQWLITRKRFCPLCKKDICATEDSALV